jgi:hypothetical protein
MWGYYEKRETMKKVALYGSVIACALLLGGVGGVVGRVRTNAVALAHSPLQGFFHAHLGWLITGLQADPHIYGKWLLKDPISHED